MKPVSTKNKLIPNYCCQAKIGYPPEHHAVSIAATGTAVISCWSFVIGHFLLSIYLKLGPGMSYQLSHDPNFTQLLKQKVWLSNSWSAELGNTLVTNGTSDIVC